MSAGSETFAASIKTFSVWVQVNGDAAEDGITYVQSPADPDSADISGRFIQSGLRSGG